MWHVLDAALRDLGGADDCALRQTVHRPQPQDLPGPDPSHHVEPPSFSGPYGSPSITGMRGKTFNGGAVRQYSVGWTAVLIRNIGGVERT